MDPILEATISRAYHRFKPFKPLPYLDACTVCCITEAQADALRSMAPRSIPHDLLYDYNCAAKPDRIDIGEFKHFLPRFLELVAQRQFLSHSIELSFCRFDHFQTSDWDPDEIELLKDYAHALFRDCLATYPVAPGDPLESIDGVLVLLSKLPIDIGPVLNEWLREPSPSSILHLKDLITKGTFHDRKFVFDESKTLGARILEWTQVVTFDERFRVILERLILEPGQLEDRVVQELSVLHLTLGY